MVITIAELLILSFLHR